MSIEGRIIVDALFHDRATNNLSSEVRVAAATYSLPLTDGTGANQAQVAWTSSGTASGSGADELIMQGLSDDRGPVSLTAVKVIYIRNKSTAYSLFVSVDNWTALDPTLLPFNAVIQPGGALAFTNPTAAGWTTGASSALSLIAAGEGQTVDYDILIIGEGTAS
jgi:hypothetical protein